MAVFSFGGIAQELKEVQESGITFEDKQLKWQNAEDVKDVVAALENTKVVHYLKLEGNTLGVNAAAAIGKALERHPEFTKALWKNMFTGRLKTEIPQALKHLGNGLMTAKAQLNTLDLSDNALGPNGMVGLEELLRSPTCYTLQVLRLNNCGLGIGGGRMLSNALLDCHRTSTEAGTPLQLKVFIAGRNRLENDGAKAIAKIFSTLKTLEHIALPQNSIYHEGIAALAEGFKQNPNLMILNLNDNTVTHVGASALGEAFAFTPNLCEINFGDCLLKTNGAYYFAEALEQNHNELEEVDLGFNEIGSDGGLALVTALQTKPNLKRLNLDGNQFGYEGRERIKETVATMFAYPNALESLDEDQSDAEIDDEEDEVDDEETDEVDDEDEVYDDENRFEPDHHNDTTDEETAEEYDDDPDEAYTTSEAFTTKMLSPNESTISIKNVSFSSNLPKSQTTTTAERFCLSQKPCTLEVFESLEGKDKHEVLRDIINQFTDDNYILVLIFTTLKVAHLAQSSNEALQLAITLYKECIDYAIKNKQERRVLNYILMQLGLLRSEEKFKSVYDVQSCRFALRETLKKEQISSDYMKNAFNVFLENND